MMKLSTRLYWSRITVPIRLPCLFGEFSVEQNELGCCVFFPSLEILKMADMKSQILQELRMLTLMAL